jgi:uncharacterized protein YndB with AHSA1/START domain
MKSKPVGLTKDVGYQMGIRRTLPVPPAEAWDFLMSEGVLKIWLGAVRNFEPGKEFETAEGISGKVTVFKPHSHLRMKWKEASWASPATLQIRTIPKGKRTTFSFHMEKLRDDERRQEMLRKWQTVLERFEEIIANQS